MIKYNSKTIFIPVLFVVITIALIAGMGYVDAYCMMNCSDNRNNYLFLDNVSPSSRHITNGCCCSANKISCAINNQTMTYRFNAATVKNPINRFNAQKLYSLININDPAVILKRQINRDYSRHFFTKIHPIYLQNNSLIR